MEGHWQQPPEIFRAMISADFDRLTNRPNTFSAPPWRKKSIKLQTNGVLLVNPCLRINECDVRPFNKCNEEWYDTQVKNIYVFYVVKICTVEKEALNWPRKSLYVQIVHATFFAGILALLTKLHQEICWRKFQWNLFMWMLSVLHHLRFP
jgi:hypothetical protein